MEDYGYKVNTITMSSNGKTGEYHIEVMLPDDSWLNTVVKTDNMKYTPSTVLAKLRCAIQYADDLDKKLDHGLSPAQYTKLIMPKIVEALEPVEKVESFYSNKGGGVQV